MVVCPCGVMVPSAGVGRARRGTRGPTGCFDSPATVTTQPKEPEDTPASVEKLAAAAAATTEPSSIPRPLSRGSKNKGSNRSSDDIKAALDSSRTTLALATTESGRYVGTRPLRSNRSPTPTLHRLPQKAASRDNSAGGVGGGGGGGRPTKHLPAVRTSPTSPLDNHQDTGASRGPSRLKGPTALPRQNGLNAVNQRMNDINSNQRRLLKQTNATQLRIPAANTATKTFHDFDDRSSSTAQTRIYENILCPWPGVQDGATSLQRPCEKLMQVREREYDTADRYYGAATEACLQDAERSQKSSYAEEGKGDRMEEVIYENLAHLRSNVPSGSPHDESTVDAIEGKQVMKSSSDSLNSDESLVWLSDSWKYNTIKKAPEFNIFEFGDIDQEYDYDREMDDNPRDKNNEKNKGAKEKTAAGKGQSARKREMTLEKGKKMLRSKLPLFRWKSDKQNNDKDHKQEKNKTEADPVVKAPQTSDRALKPDKKRGRNAQDLPESPVNIHRSKMQKPSTDNASLGLNDFLQRAGRDDANLCKTDGGGAGGERGGASCSLAENQSHLVRPRTYKSTQNELQKTSRSPSSRTTESRLAGKQDKFKQTGKPGEEREWRKEREGERNKRGNMSLGVQSCGSTLISPGQHRPSPSPQMAHRVRGGEVVTSIPSPSTISIASSSSSSSSSSISSFLPPIPSPNPSGGKVSQKTRRGNLPLDCVPFPLSSSSSSSSISSSSPSLEGTEDKKHDNTSDGIYSTKSKPRQHALRHPGEKKNKQTSWTSSPQVKPPCPRLSDPRRHISKNSQPTSLRQPQTSRNDLEGKHSGPDSNLVPGDPLKHQRQQQHPINLLPDKKSSASTDQSSTHEGRKANEGEKRDAGGKDDGKRETEFREKTRSSMSPYNTISKKARRKRKAENDNEAYNDPDDDDSDKRDGDRETGRRHEASLASRDTENFAPPPESSWESKRNPTSRRALKELHYSNNVQGYHRPPPSPSPSCPPSVEDRQGPHCNQYYSLPQLYLGSQDLPQPHRPLKRDRHFDASTFKPYYMSDLYKTPIPGISKNRRYSQTSLIDQALESLEQSSLTDTECELNTTSQGYWKRENQGQDNSWVSSSRRSSKIATSPVLPPLPAGVLDRVSPEQNEKVTKTSPEGKTNLANVCILSFDLTLDCEELSTNGFKVVDITNNSVEETSDENKCDKKQYEIDRSCDSNTLEFVDDDITFLIADDDLTSEIDCDNSEKEDTASNRSLSLSIDDKYYENDDYDNIEDISCDFISEAEQEQLDHSAAFLPEKQESNDEKRVAEDEDEDFIDIDCDVKPMETLKRPLVYGYGTGPVSSMKGKSYLEKRLSLASDYSEYLEMDIAEPLCNKEPSQVVKKKSESCMNLRETYWDYWQAKRGIKGQPNYQTSSDSSSNCSPKGPTCPSERFCYDPEVLLAHVRCPKSLEDATFRQYSAYVKSHIHEYFGNVQDTLNEYGLSATYRNWISSQPDLLPDTTKHTLASDIALDYSSEPELPGENGGNSQYRISSHQYPKRAPLPRPPPVSLRGRDLSQDSGTWTYLQSSQEFALDMSTTGAYPVPLPRSTSSLSHIVPTTYDPWQHLLPDVTPPRTPRHSIYSTAKRKGPVSQSASSSPNRGMNSSNTVISESVRSTTSPHHAAKSTTSATLVQVPQQIPPVTPSKRSFFPSLSKVVRSPLKRPNQRIKTVEKENSMDELSDLPAVHPSIQKRTHTATSSKSSSSSSSSSSASSKDSVTTVIPASARNKGPNWLMKHFGGARSKMTAV